MKYLWVLIALFAINQYALAGSAGHSADSAYVAEHSTSLDGRVLYDQWCAGCHDPEIVMNSGTRRLAIRSGERLAVLLNRTDLPVEYIKLVVRQGLMMMPPFRPSEISAQQLDALAEFISDSGKRAAEGE